MGTLTKEFRESIKRYDPVTWKFVFVFRFLVLLLIPEKWEIHAKLFYATRPKLDIYDIAHILEAYTDLGKK
jgi:hypothetical protein